MGFFGPKTPPPPPLFEPISMDQNGPSIIQAPPSSGGFSFFKPATVSSTSQVSNTVSTPDGTIGTNQLYQSQGVNGVYTSQGYTENINTMNV